MLDRFKRVIRTLFNVKPGYAHLKEDLFVGESLGQNCELWVVTSRYDGIKSPMQDLVVAGK